jgi:hypothetical protein
MACNDAPNKCQSFWKQCIDDSGDLPLMGQYPSSQKFVVQKICCATLIALLVADKCLYQRCSVVAPLTTLIVLFLRLIPYHTNEIILPLYCKPNLVQYTSTQQLQNRRFPCIIIA